MNLRQYIGIPYKYHGRTLEGMDCYGLISMIYSRELGIKLPDFDYAKHVEVKEVDDLDFFKVGWTKITLEEVKQFDVIAFKNFHLIGQVGMYLGDGKFIHTAKRTGSVISKLSQERKRRIIGVYRWQLP